MMLGVSSHAKKTYCTDNTILTYLDISILLLCTYIAKLLNSYFQIYINSLSRKYILFYCKNYDDFIENFSRGFVIFNIRYQKEGYFGNFLFGFTLDIYLLLILTFIFLFREIFVWEPKPAWIGFIIQVSIISIFLSIFLIIYLKPAWIGFIIQVSISSTFLSIFLSMFLSIFLIIYLKPAWIGFIIQVSILSIFLSIFLSICLKPVWIGFIIQVSILSIFLSIFFIINLNTPVRIGSK